MRQLLATLLLVVGIGFAMPSFAQTSRTYDAALKQGNDAYNNEDYEVAVKAYTAAIQAAPGEAVAYRNLARSYFWKGSYAAAGAYYDHYLRLAAKADDVEQVKAERRLAADRARDAVYTLPDAQRLALEALNKELESGRAYTSGGGGAWGLYETLLRTGYAEPQLEQLRSRLSRRLLDEFDATLIPDSGRLTPRLDLDAWQLQAERIAAGRTVADDPALREVMGTRSTVVEAAIALLTSQWDQAAELARLARASNPDVLFIGWFEASALMNAEKYDQALNLLNEFEKQLAERDPKGVEYARVLRAIVLQRIDRQTEAADLYLDVLRR